jgi:hypothetical protein
MEDVAMPVPRSLATLSEDLRAHYAGRVVREGAPAVAAALDVHPLTILSAIGGGRVTRLLRQRLERAATAPAERPLDAA